MASQTTVSLVLVLLFSTLDMVKPGLGATSKIARASAAVSAAHNSAKASRSEVSGLLKSGGVSPRDAEAIKSCVENFGDATDKLGNSLKEFPLLTKAKAEAMVHLDNIDSWTSTAETDAETCIEGAREIGVRPALMSQNQGSVSGVEKLANKALKLISLIRL